jgi:hypothetical protein
MKIVKFCCLNLINSSVNIKTYIQDNQTNSITISKFQIKQPKERQTLTPRQTNMWQPIRYLGRVQVSKSSSQQKDECR